MVRKKKNRQVRIQHQKPPKRKILLKFILFLFIIGLFLVLYQKENAETPSETKKENLMQKQERPALIDNNIKKQIQEDYKSNLLKQKMAEDFFRHKKNQYISKTAAEKSENYTAKDGVDLDQDKSFDDLLSILKTTEEETDEEDIEDRIAGYRIIEKKIQSFQGEMEDRTNDSGSTNNAVDPRKTYAQEFIENARRGGYEVKLDDNFKVKSVKKIKP